MAWAHSVGTMLRQVPVEKRQSVWDKWIKAYWDRRIPGLPLLLCGREVEGMIAWSIQLGSVFPEVVDLLIKSPKPIPETSNSNTYLYMELKDSGLEIRYPGPLAILLS
jgi:Domain of unknown function (DUF4020)